jgi:hypothetical protein
MSRESIKAGALPVAIVAALLAMSTWVVTAWPELAW